MSLRCLLDYRIVAHRVVSAERERAAAADHVVQGNLSHVSTTLLPHDSDLIGGKQASEQSNQEAKAPADLTLHSRLPFPSRTGWGFGGKRLDIRKACHLQDLRSDRESASNVFLSWILRTFIKITLWAVMHWKREKKPYRTELMNIKTRKHLARWLITRKPRFPPVQFLNFRITQHLVTQTY